MPARIRVHAVSRRTRLEFRRENVSPAHRHPDTQDEIERRVSCYTWQVQNFGRIVEWYPQATETA